MLAATLGNLNDVTFPIFVSPKLDGIRCLIHNGIAVSRNLKPIPNAYVQEILEGLPEGLDGELMLFGKKDFNAIQSAIMSEDGKPDFYYAIFDTISKDTFAKRYHSIQLLDGLYRLKVVPIILAHNIEVLELAEKVALKDGYEGVMLRSQDSPYKFGRSTLKEGYLLKYKRFKDSEAIIIDFGELQHNENEQTKDKLGNSKRSSHKAGLSNAGCLGSLVVFDPTLNVAFNIGTGFTQEVRQEIWDNRVAHKGKTITYTYQELTSKGQPRFPSFKGFRYE